MIGFHGQDQYLHSQRSDTQEFEWDYLGWIESGWDIADSWHLRTIQICS